MVEPETQVIDAPKGGLRDGRAQMGGEVLRGGVGEDVSVRVNETGENGVCGEVGYREAGGRGIGDGLDPVACDEDVGVSADLAGTHIDELAGEDGLRKGGLGWRLGYSNERRENEGGGKEEG